MRIKTYLLTGVVIAVMLLSACSALPSLQIGSHLFSKSSSDSAAAAAAPTATVAPAASVPQLPAQAPAASAEGIAALQGTLEAIYNQVNPSVVNVQVTINAPAGQSQSPFDFPFPFGQGPSESIPQQGLGSGFVWDTQGHIVTNNHVVDGADQVMVTFSDGRILPAKVVGKDPDADLAVLRVDAPANTLHPLTLADSDQVKVGQLAIAIGNPFGLEGSMTVGIISGLGRSLPANTQTSNGPVYTIPDVIQTDAAINPGNSGGVLVDTNGHVIGVTAAIASPVQANSGVGFVIPANIVRRVVPELIQNGKFEHPWLGISGTTLNPLIAKEMGLKEDQRGVLVVEVTAGSPADKAGLRGSERQVKINGQDLRVGGDVIVAIDGQPITTFDDLAAYLVKQGEVGKAVRLEVLRQGKTETLQATLSARPAQTEQASARATVWLGIRGMNMTPKLARAMNLNESQTGILVVEVAKDSPAEKAGLRGSDRTVEINDFKVSVGGDIITRLDGQPVTSLADLKSILAKARPGDQMQAEILRAGKTLTLDITLEAAPIQ